MDPAVRELELPQLPWTRCKTELSIWCRQRISLGPAPLSKPTAELCQHSLSAPWALLGQQPNTRQPNTFPSAELPSDTHRLLRFSSWDEQFHCWQAAAPTWTACSCCRAPGEIHRPRVYLGSEHQASTWQGAECKADQS